MKKLIRAFKAFFAVLSGRVLYESWERDVIVTLPALKNGEHKSFEIRNHSGGVVVIQGGDGLIEGET